MPQTTEETFRTRDVALAAWLRYCGLETDKINFDEEVRSAFWEYDTTPALMEAVDTFVQGDASAEPVHFLRCHKLSKDQLFDWLRKSGHYVDRHGR